MSAGAIVLIAVAALILIGLLVVLSRRARERRLDTRRDEAHRIRRDAEVSSAQADQTRAEADERAARARREEAAAREQAALAEASQRDAQERHAEADRIDPDADQRGTDEREALDRHERETQGIDPGGVTSHGHEA
jgi:F0F1-type ATP synthase membrane subunit b/b'